MKAEFDIKNGLLGDSIWPEPALADLGRRRGEPVRLYVPDKFLPLYEDNPDIVIADEPGGVLLDESAAWKWASDRRTYFSLGFWPQVGLEGPDEGSRIAYKKYDLSSYLDSWIVVCPFSRSCGSSRGWTANKTMPPAWWEELFDKIGEMTDYPIWTLGASEEPKFKHVRNWRGIPLDSALMCILNSRLLLTVDTFAMVAAGGKTTGDTLLLCSANRPSLIVPPGAIESGRVAAHHAEHPWEWDQSHIVEMMKILLYKDEQHV